MYLTVCKDCIEYKKKYYSLFCDLKFEENIIVRLLNFLEKKIPETLVKFFWHLSQYDLHRDYITLKVHMKIFYRSMQCKITILKIDKNLVFCCSNQSFEFYYIYASCIFEIEDKISWNLQCTFYLYANLTINMYLTRYMYEISVMTVSYTILRIRL